MYKTSEALDQLAGALSKAQGEISAAKQDAKNKFLKNSYSTLDAVWSACRVPLSKNGLSIIQLPAQDGEHLVLTTRLLHESGQWIESVLVGQLNKNKGVSELQAMGGAITYLRRYALASMVGITSDDDVDGNGVQPTEKPQSQASGEAPIEASIISPYPAKNGYGSRPWLPVTLKVAMLKRRGEDISDPTPARLKYVRASLNKVTLGDEDARHALTKYLYGYESTNDLNGGEVEALIAWIGANKGNDFQPDSVAVTEAQRVAELPMPEADAVE